MPAFNERLAPKERFGIPAPLIYYGGGSFICLAFSVVPIWPVRILMWISSVVMCAYCIYATYHHNDAALLDAKIMSKKELKARHHLAISEF